MKKISLIIFNTVERLIGISVKKLASRWNKAEYFSQSNNVCDLKPTKYIYILICLSLTAILRDWIMLKISDIFTIL